MINEEEISCGLHPKLCSSSNVNDSDEVARCFGAKFMTSSYQLQFPLAPSTASLILTDGKSSLLNIDYITPLTKIRTETDTRRSHWLGDLFSCAQCQNRETKIWICRHDVVEKTKQSRWTEWSRS
jgi:hypothetical protein